MLRTVATILARARHLVFLPRAASERPRSGLIIIIIPLSPRRSTSTNIQQHVLSRESKSCKFMGTQVRREKYVTVLRGGGAKKSKCKIILRHFSLHHHRFVLFFSPAFLVFVSSSPAAHPNFSINCDFTPSAHIYINSRSSFPFFFLSFFFGCARGTKFSQIFFLTQPLIPISIFPEKNSLPPARAVFIVSGCHGDGNISLAAGIFTRKYFLEPFFRSFLLSRKLVNC